MGLENGARLEVEKIVREAQENCPVGNANKAEIAHLKEGVDDMKDTQKEMFLKLDKHQEATNSKFDSIFKLVITELLTVVTGIAVGIVLYMINRGGHPH